MTQKKQETPAEKNVKTPKETAVSMPPAEAEASAATTSVTENSPGSAPELPSAVAHQYGLTHYQAAKHKAAEQAPLPNEELPEDDKTRAAVDDIVSKEGDAVLAAEDARFAPPEAPKKRGFWRTFFAPLRFWWRHKWLRWLTILLVFGGVGVAASMPDIRYAVLNKAGVRSSASVTVIDQTTQLPLKNVQVSLDGISAKTNKEGVAKLYNISLGPHTLTLERPAFATITKQIVIGWGSNPLGSFNMSATGVQYTITAHDYLSGKPVTSAEANAAVDDLSALADKQGKIVLAVNDTDVTELKVQITAPGYRTETLSLSANNTAPVDVTLVPERKAVFVSKQSGKYDLYTMDLDGKNRTVVLPATGNEHQNISLAVNPSGDQVALVSTRDALHDEDGYTLSTLTLVNLTDSTNTTLEHATQIQLVDWIGSRLIYRITTPGTSDSDSQHYRLISYDYQSKKRVQLASANQFNAIVSAGGIIYYTVSGAQPDTQPGLFKIKPDGTSKIHLFQQEVWTLIRTGYNTLALQTPDNWYAYTLGDLEPKAASQPGNYDSRLYVESADGKRSLWAEDRDGKGTLLLHDNKADTDTTVQAQDGLTYPMRWFDDNTILYRVANSSETALYAKSLQGGEPRKITDVTNTYGFMR